MAAPPDSGDTAYLYTERQGDVVLAVPPSEVTDETLEAFLCELIARQTEPGPYAVVFDLTHAGRPSAKQRSRMSQHLQEQRGTIQRQVRGMAMVAPSAITRGVITAVFWLSPPPVEHRVFDGRDEAFHWARSLLSRT